MIVGRLADDFWASGYQGVTTTLWNGDFGQVQVFGQATKRALSRYLAQSPLLANDS